MDIFHQPNLLERILNYAIHDKNLDLRYKTLCSVRLVQKRWLTAVTMVMRQRREPLYKLVLDENNSLDGAQFVQSNGKLLDQFVNLIENRIKAPCPTFSLEIEEEFFRLENYNSLKTCFHRIGEGLVLLKMNVPKYAGSLPGIFPNVKLRMMRKLVVGLTGRKLDSLENESSFAKSKNIAVLFQCILDAASTLNTIEISGDYLPLGVELVSLPITTISLDLNCVISCKQLDLLARKNLPNLAELNLNLSKCDSTGKGLLSKVLQNFCKTLQVLRVDSITFNGPPRNVHQVRFSIMKELRDLSIKSSLVKLVSDHPNLKDCFPNLTNLTIHRQTAKLFEKWTTNSCLDSVKYLDVHLVDETMLATHPDYILPITKDCMQNIHWSFSSLSPLTLTLSGRKTCGLEYLFKEMRQLTSLQIMVHLNESALSPDHWDSLFIGAPVSLIIWLKENPDYWSNMELKDNVPSIRNLKELQYLWLRTFDRGGQPNLISDLSFFFGFMKMPNLQKLSLGGKFQASHEMATEWKKKGRGCLY